jgi:Domain of unknown function (DUF5047)
MRATSDAFARVITESHQYALRVDVLVGGEVAESGLPVTVGSITWDRQASIFARATVSLADPLDRSVLAPYGNEIQIHRGVNVDGTDELLSLGVFPIQKSAIGATKRLMAMTLEDRSRIVSDARFEDDYKVAAGVNYVTAIEDLLADGYPTIEVSFPTTGYTTPQLVFDAQSDRWKAAEKMARSIGMEIFFDGAGVCVMRPEPTFLGTPVATISTGVNMVDMDVALDRTGTYNRVVATGRNASNTTVPRGVATDDDPTSSTFYDGPFGRRPRFYSSEFLATNAQATDAAAGILQSQLGLARSVEFEEIPDPRRECSDLIAIYNSELGVDELHIVDQLTLGLDPGSTLRGKTRTKVAA